MKKINFMMTMILTVSLCASSALLAADGHWINTDSYPAIIKAWATPGMWDDGTIADGYDSTAYFTNGIDTPNIGQVKGIQLGAETISHVVTSLDIYDQLSFIAFVGGSLTLTNSPTINVSTNYGGLVIGFPGFGGSLAGTEGFALNGGGRLYMDQPSSISGPVNINAGFLRLRSVNDNLQNADLIVNDSAVVEAEYTDHIFNSVVVNSGGTFQLGITNTITAPSITVKAGGVFEPNPAIPNGNIANGSPITVENGGLVDLSINCEVYNHMTIAGIGIGTGAIDSRGNYQTVSISNVTLSAAGRIGALSVGNVVNVLGKVDGAGELTIHGQAGALDHPISFNIHGSNTYNGNTTLIGNHATPVVKVFGPQTFPNNTNALAMTADVNGMPTLDLNGFDQEFSYFNSSDSGIKAIKDSGGSGILRFMDKDYNGDYVMGVEDGTVLIQGGTVYAQKYVYIRNNASLIVTGGTFKCDLEFMPGHAGAAGNVTVSDIGVLDIFVYRNGDTDDSSVCNLNAGGILKVCGMYAFGTGIPETSYLNFDGGTLSDGTWAEWNGSYANWIQTFTNLIVKAGGANIEVNNVNGRGIIPALLHDPALGGTPDGGLTKKGAETLTLGGNNTYTGPTVVQAGTLIIEGDISPSIGITISSGAKIGGPGSVGDLTVQSGATVSPGTSIGTLFADAVVMETGSEYDWEVSAASADLISANETFTIPDGGMTVNVIDAGSPDGSTYTLVTSSGIVGDPANITMNYGIRVAGPDSPTLSGNNLVANIIPEPATLGFLAFLGLVFLRRK